jgi:hypothetical protein
LSYILSEEMQNRKVLLSINVVMHLKNSYCKIKNVCAFIPDKKKVSLHVILEIFKNRELALADYTNKINLVT